MVTGRVSCRRPRSWWNSRGASDNQVVTSQRGRLLPAESALMTVAEHFVKALLEPMDTAGRS